MLAVTSLESRQPKLPELKTFQDLFLEYRPRFDLDPGRIKEIRLAQKDNWYPERGRRNYPCYLTGFLTIAFRDGSREHIDVLQVSPVVIDYFQNNVLGVGSDRMNFEVIEHKRSKYASVILHHSLIIGSHFLAEIKRDSIPHFGKEP